MNVNEIKRRLREQPFEPFRVVTSDGESHVIRHPELAMIAQGQISRVLYIFEPAESEQDEVKLPKSVSLTHITTLEPIEPEASS